MDLSALDALEDMVGDGMDAESLGAIAYLLANRVEEMVVSEALPRSVESVHTTLDFRTPMAQEVAEFRRTGTTKLSVEIADKMLYEIQRALYALVRRASKMAKELAPVDTGAMRASIYVGRPYRVTQHQSKYTQTMMQQTRGYAGAVKSAVKHSLTIGRHSGKSHKLSIGNESLYSHMRTMTRYGPYSVLKTREKIYGSQRPGKIGLKDAFDIAATQYDFMPFGMDTSGNNLGIQFGVAVYYAGYVEYGHMGRNGTRIPAQPFFGPAVAYIERNMRSAIRHGIQYAVGEQSKSYRPTV